MAETLRILACVSVVVLFALAGCVSGQKLVDGQRVEMPAGGRSTVPFHLDIDQGIQASTETRNDASYDACLIKGSEAPFWMNGDRSYAKGCKDDVRTAAFDERLAAGDWALAFECPALVGSCVVSATVTVA
jgi:hypothetical protein